MVVLTRCRTILKLANSYTVGELNNCSLNDILFLGGDRIVR